MRVYKQWFFVKFIIDNIVEHSISFGLKNWAIDFRRDTQVDVKIKSNGENSIQFFHVCCDTEEKPQAARSLHSVVQWKLTHMIKSRDKSAGDFFGCGIFCVCVCFTQCVQIPYFANANQWKLQQLIRRQLTQCKCMVTDLWKRTSIVYDYDVHFTLFRWKKRPHLLLPKISFKTNWCKTKQLIFTCNPWCCSCRCVVYRSKLQWEAKIKMEKNTWKI